MLGGGDTTRRCSAASSIPGYFGYSSSCVQRNKAMVRPVSL
jgi:hypothetical protein